jgi:hypothetical protein
MQSRVFLSCGTSAQATEKDRCRPFEILRATEADLDTYVDEVFDSLRSEFSPCPEVMVSLNIQYLAGCEALKLRPKGLQTGP